MNGASAAIRAPAAGLLSIGASRPLWTPCPSAMAVAPCCPPHSPIPGTSLFRATLGCRPPGRAGSHTKPGNLHCQARISQNVGADLLRSGSALLELGATRLWAPLWPAHPLPFFRHTWAAFPGAGRSGRCHPSHRPNDSSRGSLFLCKTTRSSSAVKNTSPPAGMGGRVAFTIALPDRRT